LLRRITESGVLVKLIKFSAAHFRRNERGWRDWTGNFRQDLQNYQDSEDIGLQNLNLAGTRGSNYLNLESGAFAKSNGE